MSSEHPSHTSTENHTLKNLNQERARMLKEVLEKNGIELRIPETAIVQYLSDINPDLFDDVYLLGPPEKIMPAVMEAEASKKFLLYFSSEAGECEEMERQLDQLGTSEGNAISAMRGVLLFAGLTDYFPAMQRDTLVTQIMGRTLTERAIFLAGKYNLELPPEWTNKTPRDRIGHLLLRGVQDPTGGINGEEPSAGGSELGVALNNLFHQDIAFLLDRLFERHPNPTDLAKELLDIDAFGELMMLQKRNPIQS